MPAPIMACSTGDRNSKTRWQNTAGGQQCNSDLLNPALGMMGYVDRCSVCCLLRALSAMLAKCHFERRATVSGTAYKRYYKLQSPLNHQTEEAEAN